VRWPLLAALALTTLAGCSQEPKLSAEGERGRQIYLSQCIACHNPDPSKTGPIGPEVRGGPAELLRAKVIDGTYPPGYTPKRPTKLMQPMPHLGNVIPALADFRR
jgi:mono/diheme cytochrome c family protein